MEEFRFFLVRGQGMSVPCSRLAVRFLFVKTIIARAGLKSKPYFAKIGERWKGRQGAGFAGVLFLGVGA